MSSGMNRTRAGEYAKTMTYKQAINNIKTGKGFAYRKATMIKLHELAEIADKLVRCKDCKHWYADADAGMACEFTNMGQPEDGYCNWGKRREDGEA